jgi:hypothetical protein
LETLSTIVLVKQRCHCLLLNQRQLYRQYADHPAELSHPRNLLLSLAPSFLIMLALSSFNLFISG